MENAFYAKKLISLVGVGDLAVWPVGGLIGRIFLSGQSPRSSCPITGGSMSWQHSRLGNAIYQKGNAHAHSQTDECGDKCVLAFLKYISIRELENTFYVKI